MNNKHFKFFLLLYLLLNSQGLISAPDKIISRKRGRLERADINVKKINRKKVKQYKPKGPQFSSSAIMVNVYEKKLIKGINKTIRYLNKTANRLPRRSLPRFKMLNRVLNLHVEQAAYLADGENDYYNAQWKRWNKNGQKGREPTLNTNKSKERWALVAVVAEKIMSEYSRSRFLPEVIFSGALAHQFLNQRNKAINYFTIITNKYPSSRFAGDAYFALGDDSFDRNNFKQASAYYLKSLRYKKSDRYGWALFKIAWSQYNLGKYKEALRYWKTTVTYSNRKRNKKVVLLKQEALRDMIYAFVEIGSINQAINYYKQQKGMKYIPNLLEAIAQNFTNQGKFDLAIKVWKQLINMIPNSEKAFIAQTEITSLIFELDKFKFLWKEVLLLNKKYRSGSRWSKNNRNMVKVANKKIKELTLYYPKMIHKMAQKSNSKVLYNNARVGYNLFTKLHPRSRELAEIYEYLADIYFFNLRYKSSGKVYEKIVRMGPNRSWIYNQKGVRKKNIHKRSAENMLDSFTKNFAPEFKRLIKTKPDFKKPPKRLSMNATYLIRGCKTYQRFYPNNSEVNKNCLSYTAEIYYRLRDTKRANKYFWQIVSSSKDRKEVENAASTLVYINKNNPVELSRVSTKLLTIPTVRTSSVGKRLLQIQKDLEIKLIAKEKNDVKRANLYKKQALKYPNDKQADKFLYNAFVAYMSSGDYQNAINTLETLIKKYPRSSLYGSSLFELGKMNDDILNLKKASLYYSKYLAVSKRSQNREILMRKVCRIEIALGSTNAFNSCKNYAFKYRSKSKFTIYEYIESLFRSKKYSEMNQLINTIYFKLPLTNNEKVIANYKLYKAYGAKANGAKAVAGIRRIAASAGNIQGEALRYVGEILYSDVKNAHLRLNSLKLVGGHVNSLQKSIEQNLAALSKLEGTYKKLFNSKDSYWGIVALYNLGEAYNNFAEKLKNPPTIKGVTKNQLVKQLGQSVNEMNNKAKLYFSTALSTMRKFQIFNDTTPKIVNSINRIFNRSIQFDEIILTPDYVGSEVPESLKDEF